MPTLNKKKGLWIAFYTITLTLVILLCFLFFIRKSDINTDNIPQIFYYGNTNSEIVSYSSVTSKQLHDYFKQAFFKNLPLLIITICFFILLFSIILIYVIKYLDHKHQRKIANDLSKIANTDISLIKEPLLQEEYQLIQKKMIAFENDQQRLHSYIAHEQKNLLMLIKGRITENIDPNIISDIDKLATSVDDILTLSTHKDSDIKSTCDLAIITAEECDHYHAVYSKLRFNFEEDGNYTIKGKEQWLRRALDNLIENAIKYGKEKKIEVSLKQKYNSVILYVQDHGIGIKEEDQDHIFEYGYQIYELKKDGYGIGLSLVHHVCDLCDGFIHLKSNPKKGSLFILSFPLITE